MRSISFTEITLEQTCEATAMTSLILGHFMNSVMDGIKIRLLGIGSDAHLVGIGTGFGHHAFFKVGLGVPHAVSEQFGELRCMFSLFPSITLKCLGDFRISLASA